jgi:hypothetical protein
LPNGFIVKFDEHELELTVLLVQFIRSEMRLTVAEFSHSEGRATTFDGGDSAIVRTAEQLNVDRLPFAHDDNPPETT